MGGFAYTFELREFSVKADQCVYATTPEKKTKWEANVQGFGNFLRRNIFLVAPSEPTARPVEWEKVTDRLERTAATLAGGLKELFMKWRQPCRYWMSQEATTTNERLFVQSLELAMSRAELLDHPPPNLPPAAPSTGATRTPQSSVTPTPSTAADAPLYLGSKVTYGSKQHRSS